MSPAPLGLAIVGPTASGKTVLGLQLAKKQNGEIISVDSRQVYRGLSVGTAKPTGTWSGTLFLVQGCPYHLVDILDPAQTFSAADFVRLANQKIQEIRTRGHTPILVGGTGFYFKALFEGLAPLPPADPPLRKELRQMADSQGRPALHRQLAQVDPEAASRIPANNIQRLIRALEVFKLTGKPISAWHREHRKAPSPCTLSRVHAGDHRSDASLDRWHRFYRSIGGAWGEAERSDAEGEGTLTFEVIGLDPGKEELDRRIETRCRAMLANGMIEETQALLAKGTARDCPGLGGLGYPRVLDYLDGQLDREDLLKLLIRDTRQYAKRQRTWFRHQQKGTWKR